MTENESPQYVELINEPVADNESLVKSHTGVAKLMLESVPLTIIDVTRHAHRRVPLQRNLRIIWLCFCIFVAGIWTKVFFDNDLSEKKCFVTENSDGTYKMIERQDKSLINNDMTTNVSKRFEYLSESYLAHSVLSLMTASL